MKQEQKNSILKVLILFFSFIQGSIAQQGGRYMDSPSRGMELGPRPGDRNPYVPRINDPGLNIRNNPRIEDRRRGFNVHW